MLSGEGLPFDSQSSFGRTKESTGRTGAGRLVEFCGEDVAKIIHTLYSQLLCTNTKVGQ